MQTIDFTREDFGGSWVFFVTFVAIGLSMIRKGDLTGGGTRKAVRAIVTKVLLGALLAIPLVVLFEAWIRWPSRQYFVSLRWEADHIVLDYRWPKDEVIIPLRDIVRLSTVHRGGRRGGNQEVVETGTESIRSSGFGTLTEAEQVIWKELHAAVEHQSTAITNLPPAKTLP